MRGKPLLLGGGLIVLAVTSTLYWRLQADTPASPAATATMSATNTDRLAVPAPSNAEQQALLGNPAVQAQEQRLAFHAAYRDFVSNAAKLSSPQREAQARALSEQIEAYEQRSELAMSESLLLQLGLIQLTASDEQEQKEQAAALVARYKARSAEQAAKAPAPSAEFQRYKTDEKRIVAEVMSMDSIPAGLSRDEYLRQRLQQAREQHY
ncbi:hypothetical protein [Pseudomonas sp.]|uniref:hypothetical protein n=1 Tax=Pseudomonas sp. TaxID=306 RepID=UPI003C730D4A